MSEEEIIKGITNIIYTCNDVIEDKEWYGQEEIESAKEQLKFTEGLLDLYNKEKEKNKELMLDKKAFTDNYGNMILKIAELEKENKEIRQWKYVIDTYEDLDKLKALDLIKIKGKEYISKDKIKDIISKLEKEQEQNSKELAKGIDYLSKEMIEASSKKIEINLSIRKYLQELLEGDK